MSQKFSKFFNFRSGKFRQLLQNSAAGAVNYEYALILALIAGVSIASVAIYGKDVAKLLNLGTSAANTAYNHAVKDHPTVDLSVSPGNLHPADDGAFTWSTTGATRIDATASITGNCDHGAGTENLGWSGLTGSISIPWSQDMAGCSMHVTIDATNGTYRASGSTDLGFAIADITPKNLHFISVLDADPLATTPSNTATVDGVELPAPLNVQGGLLSIDGGAWTDSANAPVGASIKLRTIAPAAFGASKSVTYQAGNASGTWTVATRVRDFDPDQFDFASRPKVNPGYVVASETIAALTGFDGPVPVNATNGALLSKDGSSFSASGNLEVSAGDSIWVQLTAPDAADGSGSATTTVSVGATSADFTLSTRDLTPDAFVFNAASKAEPGQIVTSQTTAALGGFDGTLTAAATNGASLSTDGISFSPAVQISAGEILYVRLTASSDVTGAGSASTTVSVGGAAADFTVATRDETPDAIAFNSAPKAEPGQIVTSQTTAALAGFDGVLTASATNGATLSTDNAAFTQSVQVSTGQTLYVRLTASTDVTGAGAVSTTVSVGTAATAFSVATKDEIPDQFSFNSPGAVNPAQPVAAQSVAPVSGFDGNLTATATNGAQISTDGVNYTATAFVTAGQNLWVQVTSATPVDGTGSVSTLVTLGGTTAPFSVQTTDFTPNSFAFGSTGPNYNGVVVSSQVASFDGFSGSANITFSSNNAPSATLNVYRAATLTWSGTTALQSVSVQAGDKIQLGMATPPGTGAIGTITGTFSNAYVTKSGTWTASSAGVKPIDCTAKAVSWSATFTNDDGPQTYTCSGNAPATANGNEIFVTAPSSAANVGGSWFTCRNGVFIGTNSPGCQPNSKF